MVLLKLHSNKTAFFLRHTARLPSSPGPPSHLVWEGGSGPSFPSGPLGGGSGHSPVHHGKVTWDPPPQSWTDWQTNMCENITFPNTTYAGGKNQLQSNSHLCKGSLLIKDKSEKKDGLNDIESLYTWLSAVSKSHWDLIETPNCSTIFTDSDNNVCHLLNLDFATFQLSWQAYL